MEAKGLPPTLREVFRYGEEYLYMDDYYALPSDDVDVCIPRRGLYILKIVVRYARKRRNWVVQVFNDTQYWGVDDYDWDKVLATVAETEAGFMSPA